MSVELVLVQLLNGLQFGLLLFLIASGLTLVFGVMGIINLAHGTFYMLGGYLAMQFTLLTGHFFLGMVIAIPIAMAAGALVETSLLRPLYTRDHLDQVLLTYGLILIINDLVRYLWGPNPRAVPTPAILSGTVSLLGLAYPANRLFAVLLAAGLAIGLWWLIARTRLGQMVRAGASNREMTWALGIDIGKVNTFVFGLGTGLAAVAGMTTATITQVNLGMGTEVLILSFVVVVVGGIGSLKGAFIGAILIGVVDTFGQVLLPQVSAMLVYVLMAGVLVWRPHGLFATR